MRLRLTVVLAFSAAVVAFVAAAGTTNPVFDGDLLADVAAHLSDRVGRPVRVGLVPRGRDLTLQVRYVPAAEDYRTESAAARQMQQLVEQAVIRYAGFVTEVAVRAVPPEDLLGAGEEPAGRSLVVSVAETRRRLDRQGLLAYGDYHWPIRSEEVRPWSFVMIHHSAADRGSAGSIEVWHRRGRHWDALGYQFVIGNGSGSGDGEIEVGRRWTEQMAGAHAGVEQYNEGAAGICLVGNFQSARGGSAPTAAQMESLRALVLYLLLKFDLGADAVLLHSDVRATECPGDLFRKDDFLAEIRRDLARLRGGK